MEHTNGFLKRVLKRLPSSSVRDYHFESWEASGKVTKEGFGLLPIPGLEPEALLARVMDVDHYRGNIEYVEENRAVSDARFSAPESVRFYQRLSIPMLGTVHHELVLRDLGEIDGYRVALWELLEPETSALSAKVGIRSQYNDGAWFAKEGCVGYALSTAPRRDDVGFLKWKALTKGADIGASTVLKSTIEGMVAWARRAGR